MGDCKNPKVTEMFASQVFNDSVMRERLPKHIYNSLRSTIQDGTQLDENVAEVVASAMKDWALEKGATHFTHWFQPMTGITAEKHDSFISPTHEGRVIMEFSGKELIKGEPDASSFPSGGLRATFEARGYTAWDPTSYAFVKDNSLYIPTIFCSYSGEILDKKTPLLRSMEALSKQALRIVRLFGNKTATRVIATVGCEQEYFLIDRRLFEQREDLILTGRTLFGAKPPKGQEMEDHYFGNLKTRVADFMKELDEELWKLGVSAKTKHNEVAPAQHELAPIFTTTNLAADHNLLTMELMRKIAARHGFACLLHEKPFAGVNGSGKHNNWSISTNDGVNLLEPGNSPQENAQFLLFLLAVVQAVDEYADLLRVSVATAGNDLRLGGNEAPPSIISVYLGDQLNTIIDALEKNETSEEYTKQILETGVLALPKLPKDSSDRNRTSPFAFTGNKFEFRMLGSSSSISCTNVMINTSVAEVLSEYADILEQADDFQAALRKLLVDVIRKHKRIIFNGNNYSKEWVEEAERRGLPNLRTSVEALPTYLDPKNLKIFKKHRIYTETEVRSRYEILIENYSKTVHIEAMTMLDMARQQILPASLRFSGKVAKTYTLKKESGLALNGSAEETLLTRLSNLTAELSENIEALAQKVSVAEAIEEPLRCAWEYEEKVRPAMEALRKAADELECLVSKEDWPLPTYADMMFYVD